MTFMLSHVYFKWRICYYCHYLPLGMFYPNVYKVRIWSCNVILCVYPCVALLDWSDHDRWAQSVVQQQKHRDFLYIERAKLDVLGYISVASVSKLSGFPHLPEHWVSNVVMLTPHKAHLSHLVNTNTEILQNEHPPLHGLSPTQDHSKGNKFSKGLKLSHLEGNYY